MKSITFFGLGLWLLCSYIGMACKQEIQASPFASGLTAEAEVIPVHTTVFVCKSNGAKKYHLRQNCGGLKRCKHAVATMTSEEAEKIGLGWCGYEK